MCHRALYYLMKYGYVQPKNSSSALLTEEGLDAYLKGAIADFQVKLTVTHRRIAATNECPKMTTNLYSICLSIPQIYT